MLELTKRADYALRLMVQVAANQDGNPTTAQIAALEDIPYQFLRKVAQELVAAGLLTSRRGVRGGLTLALPAETITLLDIVRASGEPALSRCLIDPTVCTRRRRCAVYPVWRRLQRDLERAMEAVTLSDLVQQHETLLAITPVEAPLANRPNGPQKRLQMSHFSHARPKVQSK